MIHWQRLILQGEVASPNFEETADVLRASDRGLAVVCAMNPRHKLSLAPPTGPTTQLHDTVQVIGPIDCSTERAVRTVSNGKKISALLPTQGAV